MPLNKDIKKVMVIGSGPIVIGQAAEFDYAGAQACRVLRDEGLDIVLVNSNPATIMTDKKMADAIYLEPLTAETVKRIIEKEKPDSILPSLGGQTGLTIAMQLSKEVASYGADGLLLISPYYNKGTQDGVYKHFKMVADEVPGTPVILYNVPSRTGGNVLPQTVARLVKDVPNIVGIKEASGDISQIVKLMTLCDGNIDLYSGNDDQVVPLLSMGGIGVISVVANVAPKAMHDLCQKFFDGDVKGAARLQMDTHELFEALFCEVNPIPVKKAVNLMGQNAGPLRMPLTEMTPANTERLRKAMQNFGLI